MTLLLALVATGAGSVVALELDAYLSAARSGVAGEIAGRVYEERRRPELPDRGLPAAVVTLLPQPGPLLQRLDDIRRGARDSDHAFRTAVPRILEILNAHEAAVKAAGGDGLIFGASPGPDGTFTMPGIPEGTWIMVVREEKTVPGTGGKFTKKDQEMYRLGSPLKAYRSVRLWVREIRVLAGGVETVALTDRNVWFGGVVEMR